MINIQSEGAVRCRVLYCILYFRVHVFLQLRLQPAGVHAREATAEARTSVECVSTRSHQLFYGKCTSLTATTPLLCAPPDWTPWAPNERVLRIIYLFSSWGGKNNNKKHPRRGNSLISSYSRCIASYMFLWQRKTTKLKFNT